VREYAVLQVQEAPPGMMAKWRKILIAAAAAESVDALLLIFTNYIKILINNSTYCPLSAAAEFVDDCQHSDVSSLFAYSLSNEVVSYSRFPSLLLILVIAPELALITAFRRG